MAKIGSSSATGASGAPASSPIRRIVSGDIPRDPAEIVEYVVVNSSDKRVVASFRLPGRAAIPKFAITVTLPSRTETYQAGRLDDHGKFKLLNFKISESAPITTDPANATGAHHGV